MRIKPRLKSHHIAFNPKRGFGEKIKPKRQRIWRNCFSPQQNYISVHTNFFNQIDIVVRLYFWKGFKGHRMNARSTFCHPFWCYFIRMERRSSIDNQPLPKHCILQLESFLNLEIFSLRSGDISTMVKRYINSQHVLIRRGFCGLSTHRK